MENGHSDLIIYLGQKEHFITLDEMNGIIQAIKCIGNTLAEHIFIHSMQKDSLLIYPSKKGSFKINIAITAGFIAALSTFCESDIGKAFIKGLSGNEPAYYAEKSGEMLRDMIKGVLEHPISKLEELNENYTNQKFILDRAIKEKSELYTVISKSKTIQSIGFYEKNKNPIVKKNFYAHIKKGDIIRELMPEYIEKDLIIIKSINTKEDKGQWTFKIADEKRKIRAEIIDDAFLAGFFGGKYPLKKRNQDDVVKVELRIDKTLKNGSKEKEQYFIEEIFQFNDKVLKKKPKDHVAKKRSNNELTLFNIYG